MCLVTTAQPSTNPRLVKEADALVEAGYDVRVIGAHRADWAAETDARLLASRAWTFTFIDFRRQAAPALFWKTRLRHKLATSLVNFPAARRAVDAAAVSRITPELIRAACDVEADLYIAHNVGALPAAVAAARTHGAAVGFDAEDFHRGEPYAAEDVRRYAVICRVEDEQLPDCDYLTAASPLIAAEYAKLRGVAPPTCILNVFPLRERPAAFRSSSSERLTLYWFSQTIGLDRGLDDAIRAMGQLREYPLELHLRGVWQPGCRESLLAVARAAGVPCERIVVHPPAPSDDMVRLASEYDIGLALERPVALNNDILLSNKIFTYLLAGVAVVATATRAQAALAADLGEAAVTYEPGDVSQLAAALRPWLEDRSRLVTARAAAWRLGEDRYNWDVEKHRFLDVVRDVLARSRRRVARGATAVDRQSSSARMLPSA